MEIHIGRNGEAVGVYPASALSALIEGGQVLTTDLAWSAGEVDWQPLSELASKHGIPLSIPPVVAPPVPPLPPAVQQGASSQPNYQEVAVKASELAGAAGAAAIALAKQAKTAAAPLVDKAKEAVKQVVEKNESQNSSLDTAGQTEVKQAGVAPQFVILAPKSALIAYVLLFFLGVFGAHRFYLGRKKSAFMMLGASLVWAPLALVNLAMESTVVAVLTLLLALIPLGVAVVDIFRIPKMAASAESQAISVVQV